MRRVTEAEFYAAIRPLNVEVRVRGNYDDDDYGTDFHLAGGRGLVGRTRDVGDTPHYKPDTEYFLPETVGGAR